MRFRMIFGAAVLAASALFLSACSQKGEDGQGTLPKAVSLSKTELSLKVGETAMLEATVSPLSAYDKTVHWSSTHPDKVTVSAEGTVTAVAQGSAYVIAETVNAIKASCLVTVSSTADYRVLITCGGEAAPSRLYGWPGKELQLSAVSDDGVSHDYQWRASTASAGVSLTGLLSFVLGSPSGAEGYAWYGESVISAVSSDGCGASITAVSNVSDTFRLGTAEVQVGGGAVLAAGASAQLVLYWFDGTQRTEIPESAYTLHSGDASKFSVNGSTLTAGNDEGSAMLYVTLSGSEQVLCTLSIEKQSSTSNSSVESYTEEIPAW